MIRRYSEFTDGYQSSIFCGMGRNWEADTSASFARRLGKSAAELGDTGGQGRVPRYLGAEQWRRAVVGRDVTAAYEGRLPADVTVAGDERMVVIPATC
jgi:plasmid stabilization system protein ParE